MQPLTPEGQKWIADLAQKYGVSRAAVMTLLEALVRGNGSMAQFSSPELGGGGQWMRGGMTMVGDMFNNGLKATVDGLCSELSKLLASQPFASNGGSSQSQSQGDGSSNQNSQSQSYQSQNSPGQSQQSSGPGYQSQSQGGGGSYSYSSHGTGDLPGNIFSSSGGSGNWWPDGLGSPNATGSQNGMRYAYFAGPRRLAIEVNGTHGLYDTLDHQIGGFSQQQGSGGSITMSSQYGTVNLASLPRLPWPGDASAPAPSEPASTSSHGFAPAPTSNASSSGSDPFQTLERLAEMNKKGILSDAEFAEKKAEILKRL